MSDKKNGNAWVVIKKTGEGLYISGFSKTELTKSQLAEDETCQPMFECNFSGTGTPNIPITASQANELTWGDF